MRALLPQLFDWIDRGEPFALATVVAVTGSTPRTPGSSLLISADGERFLGAVSSGCLEQEVMLAAKAVLGGGPAQRLRFGPDGQPPWRDGLTCGGWIEVRVDPWWGYAARPPVRAIAPLVREWLEKDQSGVVLSRGENHFAFDATGRSAGDPNAFEPNVVADARARLATEAPPAELTVPDGETIFCRTVLRRPRLLMVGAVDIAAPLVAFARHAGFATTVVDPRKHYARDERFPLAPDQLVTAWPQSAIAVAQLRPRDAAVVLSHDPKIDDVALLALLKTPAGYIGALGSLRSHATRLERLRAAGATAADLARIHGPAGIHLGVAQAAGVALGILAGIVQAQAAALAKSIPGTCNA